MAIKNLEIKMKRNAKAKRLGVTLRKAHEDDAGYDVPVVWPEEMGSSIAIRPGDQLDIPSGISILIPSGYWAEIKARGSSFKLRNLHIHDAVWDAGFVDEIQVAVRNMGSKAIIINDGEKLAQLIYHKSVPVEHIEDEEDWPETERGTKQMGSSGL